jgi:Putative beta-barrel porin-2, OmpL-like. bbp2
MPLFGLRSKLFVIPILAACTVFAQTTTPAPAPATTPAASPDTPAAPAAAAAPTWSIGGIDFSGMVDGYYNWNNNHPIDKYNQYYNFDVQANQFSLNMMELTLNHDPDPIGFHVDFGYGKAFQIIHSAEQDPSAFQYIEQVYVSLKPPKAKGFEADFGEFYTSAGAETVYTKDNWNYSRSLLFALAVPYYHFGLRTSMPVSKTMTAGFQLVNGWNNIEDNNSGKTMGFTYAWTKPKYTWNVNYYTGPEHTDTNKNWKNLIDTTLLLTPTANFNAYINYDYAQERSLIPTVEGEVDSGVLDHYQGIAIAARQQFTPHMALAGRYEYFNDPQGYSTGIAQSLNEFTITGEYKWPEGLLARVEYRIDHSDELVYTRGTTPLAGQNQNTITFGLVGFFGPKR